MKRSDKHVCIELLLLFLSFVSGSLGGSTPGFQAKMYTFPHQYSVAKCPFVSALLPCYVCIWGSCMWPYACIVDRLATCHQVLVLGYEVRFFSDLLFFFFFLVSISYMCDCTQCNFLNDFIFIRIWFWQLLWTQHRP